MTLNLSLYIDVILCLNLSLYIDVVFVVRACKKKFYKGNKVAVIMNLGAATK